jgi:multiple antibiotic resistance protein
MSEYETSGVVWTDLRQFVVSILLIVGAILPVVNPLGDAPLFLVLTRGCDEMTRAELARRVAFYSFGLLLGSMLLGAFVLRLFGLSIPIVQVAGGTVVFALGWNILAEHAKPIAVKLDPVESKLIALGRAFYPLTLPLSIDGGVISVAITVGANHSHTFGNRLVQIFAAALGAAIVALSIWLTYRYAQRAGRRIGLTGMTVILRLSSFIVLCIGVGIIWNGVKGLLGEIGIPGSN